MERLLRAALAATMSILLVAGGTLAITQAGPDDLVTLQAAPWTLSELDGQSIDASAGITAAFGADGSLTGSAGCNDYFGDYSTDGALLTVSPLAATRKGCEQDVMDTESLFLGLLESAATWSLDGPTLTVTSSDGGALVFGGESAGEPAAFVGTEWTLESITGQDASGFGVTAIFSEDFTAGGFGGCNQYNGGYAVDGDAIVIGPLAATRKACADDVMDGENAFLNAMESVDLMAIDGQTLTLSADDPSSELVFTAGGGSTGGDVGLTGTAWSLVDLDGEPALASDAMTVTFGDDGTIDGFGGCNQVFGDYAVDGSTMTVAGLAATRRFCDPDLMDREALFIAILTDASGFAIAGEELTIVASDGAELIFSTGDTGPVATPTPEPQETPAVVSGELVGPTWVLDTLMGQSMSAFIRITIAFGADGTLAGSGGCNDYTGTYTVDGGTISIAGITTGTEECDATIKGIQDGLLQVVPFIDGWSIVDGGLSLDSSFGIETTWTAQ